MPGDYLSDDPLILQWQRDLASAQEELDHELGAARDLSSEDALLLACNALIRFWMAVGQANDNIGHPFGGETVKSLTLARWPKRCISGIELRALATSMAYQMGIRLEESGAKDSRMTAAMMAAARYEGMKTDDPVETVKKSIQRYRKKLQGQSVFWLDRQSLQVQKFGATEALLSGLPGKVGRPRRKPQAD